MSIKRIMAQVMVTDMTCDLCGESFIMESSGVVLIPCSICKRDLCDSCLTMDGEDYFCETCYDIGHKYLKQIDVLNEECDDRIVLLVDQWKEEAKNKIYPN